MSNGQANLEDLLPALLVREADLDVDLQAPGAEQGLIEHVLAVGHPDQQDVVEGVHAVNLCEHLVHCSRSDCPGGDGAALKESVAEGRNRIGALQRPGGAHPPLTLPNSP